MPRKTKRVRYIFVSGGVISALGKGVTAASISMLLKKQGYKVCPVKCENNLNVDFGTINPIEHGDPFLCFDGLEGDQDLGNYERFLNQKVGHANFMTMGQLYQTVIQKERRMEYEGEDVEPIPHIVNEIIDRFKKAAKKSDADFVVVELGGTVGEYENNNGLYYEAARILGLKEPVTHVHVTYVPVPEHIGEPKTKPAQLGIRKLMSMGINIDFLVARSEIPLDEQRKYKFAMKFHIDPRNVFSNENLKDIHQVPLHLHQQKLDQRILKNFRLKPKTIDLSDWKSFVEERLKERKQKIDIAIVGKYFGTGNSNLNDAYYALLEAIKHGGIANNVGINFHYINSDKQEKEIDKLLKGVDGIIVPIGWGSRGVEGKLKAIKYARENKIPYFGLCYGMQLAAIEFARDVIGLKGADTEENNPKTKDPIIHSIPFDKKYQIIKGDGCSMRLGTFPCVVDPDSYVYQIYEKYKGFTDKEKGIVEERHRHRFEFNNEYKTLFEKHGMKLCGTSPDDMFVEFIELDKKDHPFFIATQGHPEYKSTPLKPHPLFIEFIKVAKKLSTK